MQPCQILLLPALQEKALELYNRLFLSINKGSKGLKQTTTNRLLALQFFHIQYGEFWLQLLAGAFKSLPFGHWMNGDPPRDALIKIIQHWNDNELSSSYLVEVRYAN